MPPPPPSSTTSTALNPDVAFSTATLALARSQRFLASWAPPPPSTSPSSISYKTADTPTQREVKQQEKQEKEEDDFTPLPELAGLGAKDEGREKRDRDKDGLEKLRRELLGSRRKSGVGNVSASSRAGGLGRSQMPVAVAVKRSGERSGGNDEEEEEEEGGRSSLGKAKARDSGKRKWREKVVVGNDDDDDDGVLERKENGNGNGNEKGSQKAVKRGRGGNYLDEVLAGRVLKRRKKKEGKSKGLGDDGDGDGG